MSDYTSGEAIRILKILLENSTVGSGVFIRASVSQLIGFHCNSLAETQSHTPFGSLEDQVLVCKLQVASPRCQRRALRGLFVASRGILDEQGSVFPQIGLEIGHSVQER